MVLDRLRLSLMVLDGPSELISIPIEWFKTTKPISGWIGLVWDGWISRCAQVKIGVVQDFTILQEFLIPGV